MNISGTNDQFCVTQVKTTATCTHHRPDSGDPIPLPQGYHWESNTVIPFLGTTQQFPLVEQTQDMPFENS